MTWRFGLSFVLRSVFTRLAINEGGVVLLKPEETYKLISYIPVEYRRKLESEAVKRKQSMSGYVRELLCFELGLEPDLWKAVRL